MRLFISSAAVVLLSTVVIIGCNGSTPSITDNEAPLTNAAEATEVSFSNTACPIMGGSPSPELTRKFDGQTVGFCCDGCPEKWDALSPEVKAEKLAEVSE